MNASKKILIFAANPKDTTRLRLDEEVREIEEGLYRSKNRSKFIIQAKMAVRLRDLRRALLDHEPQIVHFCGHGEVDGLMVEDEKGNAVVINPDALAGLFQLFINKVECVLLNACYSQIQAHAINQYIEYVIGMNKGIHDRAAIEFAVGFYDALGAGKTVEEAFKFGCNAIQLYSIPKHLEPLLLKGKQIDFLHKEQNEKIGIDRLNFSDQEIQQLKSNGVQTNFLKSGNQTDQTEMTENNVTALEKKQDIRYIPFKLSKQKLIEESCYWIAKHSFCLDGILNHTSFEFIRVYIPYCIFQIQYKAKWMFSVTEQIPDPKIEPIWTTRSGEYTDKINMSIVATDLSQFPFGFKRTNRICRFIEKTNFSEENSVSGEIIEPDLYVAPISYSINQMIDMIGNAKITNAAYDHAKQNIFEKIDKNLRKGWVCNSTYTIEQLQRTNLPFWIVKYRFKEQNRSILVDGQDLTRIKGESPTNLSIKNSFKLLSTSLIMSLIISFLTIVTILVSTIIIESLGGTTEIKEILSVMFAQIRNGEILFAVVIIFSYIALLGFISLEDRLEKKRLAEFQKLKNGMLNLKETKIE